MDGPGRMRQKVTDPGTERRAFGPSFGYLVVALLVVAAAIGYGLTTLDEPVRVAGSNAPSSSAWSRASSDAAPAEPVAAESSASAAAPVALRPATESRMRDPNGDQTPDLRDYLNAGEKPTMNEVLDRLHQAGVTTGIAAFSPPGTKPHLIGLAVPDDFELPEGYVRHHQTTDDGQNIEPILMYAPGRQVLDAAGRPIVNPRDRVVPPEAAPPGLPLRRVVIPAPTEPDRAGS